jgi:hypothetical protein
LIRKNATPKKIGSFDMIDHSRQRHDNKGEREIELRAEARGWIFGYG